MAEWLESMKIMAGHGPCHMGEMSKLVALYKKPKQQQTKFAGSWGCPWQAYPKNEKDEKWTKVPT